LLAGCGWLAIGNLTGWQSCLLAGCGWLAIGNVARLLADCGWSAILLAGNLVGWFAGWLRLAGNQVRSSFVLHGMLTAHTALVTNRCYMAAGAFGS
jgi:hypothetical protein